VDTITPDKLEALGDKELLETAAIVTDELRRRGMLFAATAAIVDAGGGPDHADLDPTDRRLGDTQLQRRILRLRQQLRAVTDDRRVGRKPVADSELEPGEA
jgi:hypothetical protein